MELVGLAVQITVADVLVVLLDPATRGASLKISMPAIKRILKFIEGACRGPTSACNQTDRETATEALGKCLRNVLGNYLMAYLSRISPDSLIECVRLIQGAVSSNLGKLDEAALEQTMRLAFMGRRLSIAPSNDRSAADVNRLLDAILGVLTARGNFEFKKLLIDTMTRFFD